MEETDDHWSYRRRAMHSAVMNLSVIILFVIATRCVVSEEARMNSHSGCSCALEAWYGRRLCRNNIGSTVVGCPHSNQFVHCMNQTCTEHTCPEGQVWNGNEKTFTNCPPGFQVTRDHQKCVCNHGTKRPTNDGYMYMYMHPELWPSYTCVPCPHGSTAWEGGCACESPMANNKATNICEVCPANATAHPAGCQCESMLFMNEAEWECQPCPGTWLLLGSWSRRRRLADCRCTGENEFFDVKSVTCQKCPTGMVVNSERDRCWCPRPECPCCANVENNPCKNNNGSKLIGCPNSNHFVLCTNTTCSDQTCPAGQLWNATQNACAPCPAGFQLSPNNKSCICNEGTIPNGGYSCRTCPRNATIDEYNCYCSLPLILNAATNTCQACPSNKTFYDYSNNYKITCACDGPMLWNEAAWECQPCPGSWVPEESAGMSRQVAMVCRCTGENEILDEKSVKCYTCPSGLIANKLTEQCECPGLDQQLKGIGEVCKCPPDIRADLARDICRARLESRPSW